MAKTVELTVANFDEVVLNGEGVKIVDFWAPWCGYCVRMMPIYEALSDEMGDNVTFAKVNTDEEVDLAKKYNIEVLPTFAIFKNGEIVNKKIGFVPQAELQKVIEDAL